MVGSLVSRSSQNRLALLFRRKNRVEVSVDVGIAALKKVGHRNRRRKTPRHRHRKRVDCVVIGSGAPSFRVIKVFRVRKTKDSGRATSISSLVHRRTRAALIPAQYEPSKRVHCFARISCGSSARLDVYGDSAWQLSWSARQPGLVTRYHYNISIPRFLTLSEAVSALSFTIRGQYGS